MCHMSDLTPSSPDPLFPRSPRQPAATREAPAAVRRRAGGLVEVFVGQRLQNTIFDPVPLSPFSLKALRKTHTLEAFEATIHLSTLPEVPGYSDNA
jgi:hypothetical protein